MSADMWTQPQVQERSGRGDPIHEALRAAVCKPTRRHLWVPRDAITFVPALSDTIYGDGRTLFHLTTIQSRPKFYVLRCCSSWSESNWDPSPNFGDFTDLIRENLECEFGCARLDSEEDDPDLLAEGVYPWPAFDDEDGVAWAQVAWPDIRGLKFEQRDRYMDIRKILAREYAFEDQNGQFRSTGDSEMRGRCIICGWPMAKDQASGCIPGDCSYRPGDPAEQGRLANRREIVKRATSAVRNTFATDVPEDECRKLAVAVLDSICF